MLDAFFGVRFAAWRGVARRVGSMFVIRHFDAHTYPSTHSSRHLPSPLTVSSLHSLSLTTTNTNAGPIALPSSTHTHYKDGRSCAQRNPSRPRIS